MVGGLVYDGLWKRLAMVGHVGFYLGSDSTTSVLLEDQDGKGGKI